MIEQYGNIENFYYTVLGHHVDTTNDITTSLARSLYDLRNAIPEWLPLHTFTRLSDHNLLDKIPQHLEQTVMRLIRLLDGEKLTGGTPHWHRTFELFLLESAPQNPFSIELRPPEVDRLRAITCLEIMTKELRFNIGEHPSSFLRNKDVPNLEVLERVNISSHLRDACRHWVEQFSRPETHDADLVGLLSKFFQTHFLHWLEVMSVLSLSPVEALKVLTPARVCDLIILAAIV